MLILAQEELESRTVVALVLDDGHNVDLFAELRPPDAKNFLLIALALEAASEGVSQEFHDAVGITIYLMLLFA